VTITNNTTVGFSFWIYSDSETNVENVTLQAGTSQAFTFLAASGTHYTVYGIDNLYHEVEIFDVFTPVMDHHFFQTDKGDYDTSDGGDLLCVSTGSWSRNDYYFADGNGNVTDLVDANQDLSDPFGNIVSQDGAMAGVNVYRFSSKEIHEASGMLYYLRRFYDPDLQRWISRDPIEERGGINLYSPFANDPTSRYDSFGLEAIKHCKTCEELCAKAYSDPKNKDSNGGVVCDGELKCACAFGFREGNIKPGDCPELDEIEKRHETKHFGEIECDKNKGMDRPGFKVLPNESYPQAVARRDRSECALRKQSNAEMKAAMAKAASKCRSAMQSLIEQNELWISTTCAP
jgi:RHS repeat-associated protein